MRLPFMIFCVDQRATSMTKAMLQQWPHMNHPDGFTNHFALEELDRRGMTYACRMFGMMALGTLCIGHEEAIGRYDIFLPTPVGAERFVDQDSNVARLLIDRDAIRPRNVAVGLSSSGLLLNIAIREADRSRSVGWLVPFKELHALGAETASMPWATSSCASSSRCTPMRSPRFPTCLSNRKTNLSETHAMAGRRRRRRGGHHSPATARHCLSGPTAGSLPRGALAAGDDAARGDHTVLGTG